MALDVIILCMPITVVYKLQMSFRRKAMIMGIFWLGFLYVPLSNYTHTLYSFLPLPLKNFPNTYTILN